MPLKISAAQAVLVRRKATPGAHDPTQEGELNIVPFLDIVTNILMFLLATIATVFTATITLPAPMHDSTAGSGSDRLTVQVLREGYVVGGSNGFLLPGCTTASVANLTVPLAQGQHDTQALSRCLSAARAHPEWGPRLRQLRAINVATNGSVPYDVLVRTLDAVRETRAGAQDLFPDPALGILQ